MIIRGLSKVNGDISVLEEHGREHWIVRTYPTAARGLVRAIAGYAKLARRDIHLPLSNLDPETSATQEALDQGAREVKASAEERRAFVEGFATGYFFAAEEPGRFDSFEAYVPEMMCPEPVEYISPQNELNTMELEGIILGDPRIIGIPEGSGTYEEVMMCNKLAGMFRDKYGLFAYKKGHINPKHGPTGRLTVTDFVFLGENGKVYLVELKENERRRDKQIACMERQLALAGQFIRTNFPGTEAVYLGVEFRRNGTGKLKVREWAFESDGRFVMQGEGMWEQYATGPVRRFS